MSPKTPAKSPAVASSELGFDFDAEKIVGDKIELNEVILVDKPAGISSFGVVARVRRALTDVVTKNYNSAHPENPVKHKKVKVGHTGTLDPFATGLLILLAGKATKRSNEFLKQDKIYEAEAMLGVTSSTGDPEGELTDFKTGELLAPDLTSDEIVDKLRSAGSESAPTRAEIESAAEKFKGEIEQKVPAFSAVKINGQRAYDLARKGKPVDTPTRKVTVFSLEILEYDFPILKYRAHVSSGTYIRTLSEDLGKSLGTGAYTKELRRLRIGNMSLK